MASGGPLPALFMPGVNVLHELKTGDDAGHHAQEIDIRTQKESKEKQRHDYI